MTCRPADLIDPEMDKLTAELKALATAENIKLADDEIDDVLIYALFAQVGIKFLQNRGNADAFEPAPGSEAAETPAAPAAVAAEQTTPGDVESYRVSVNGTGYDVVVGPGDADISQVTPVAAPAAAPAPTAAAPAAAAPAGAGTELKAPLSGSVIEVLVSVGQKVNDGDPVMVIEAMKMETEVRANAGGTIQSIAIKKGDSIQADQSLMVIG